MPNPLLCTIMHQEVPQINHYTPSLVVMGKDHAIFLFWKMLTDLLDCSKDFIDLLDVVQLKAFALQDKMLSIYERSKLAIYHSPTCDLNGLESVHVT